MAGIFSNPSDADYFDPEAAKAKAAFSDCQIVAVYNANNGAHIARDALAAAGIPASAVHVIDRADANPAGTRATPEARRTALLGAFGSLFARSENPAQYHLVADPNHAIVVVSRGAGVDQARARQVLGATGPVEVYSC